MVCVCLQTDTRLVRDTSPTANSSTAPATVPAQEASPAQPKPEGWKGLSYWLATADRGVVESVLCTIRDDFMTKYAQPQSNSAAAAQQNAQAAGKWRQVRSQSSTWRINACRSDCNLAALHMVPRSRP